MWKLTVWHWFVTEKAIAQAGENSLGAQIAQGVVLPAVAGVCHAFMHGLNVTEVYCLVFVVLFHDLFRSEYT